MDREHSFVGTFFSLSREEKSALAFIARLLGITWVAWAEVERFWTLESGRPELESRCHQLLLAL